MATTTIGDDNFETAVLQAERPVLVDFWAEWCTPCKRLAPTLEEVAAELGDRVSIAKLNIEDHPDTPARYGVRSIPMLILFDGGVPVATQIGAPPTKGQLKGWLEAALDQR